MNTENPLVPQSSLLEQKNRSRSRVKTAFFCVLAVHVLAILTALIAQGCKREQPPVGQEPPPPPPTFETNPPPVMDTNPPPALPPEPPPPAPPPAVVEHVIVKGDTLSGLATKYGVKLAALQAANPNLDPIRLKIGDKVIIPAPTSGAPPGMAVPSVPEAGSEQVYVVKSGDTLTKIATQHGTTVKALRAANDLQTDQIKVGRKLKIPVKATAPAPAPVPALPMGSGVEPVPSVTPPAAAPPPR